MLKKSRRSKVVKRPKLLESFLGYLLAAASAAIVIIICVHVFNNYQPMPGGGSDVIEMPSQTSVKEQKSPVEEISQSDLTKNYLGFGPRLKAKLTHPDGSVSWLKQEEFVQDFHDLIMLIRDPKIQNEWLGLYAQLNQPLDSPRRFFYLEPIMEGDPGLETAGMAVATELRAKSPAVKLKIGSQSWGGMDKSSAESLKQWTALTLVHEIQHIRDRFNGNCPEKWINDTAGWTGKDVAKPGPNQEHWLGSLREGFASEARAWKEEFVYMDKYWSDEEVKKWLPKSEQPIYAIWQTHQNAKWEGVIYDTYYEKLYFPPQEKPVYDKKAMRDSFLEAAHKAVP